MTSIAAASVTSGAEPFYQRALPRALPAALISEEVYDPALDPANLPNEVTVTATRAGSQSGNPADSEPFSFWDFLDIINPLQHIPGVNTLYRELTGDTIKTPIKLIGSTVLGGPIGFATAMADSMIAAATGKDIGQHAMALLKTDTPAPQPAVETPVQYAHAPPARYAYTPPQKTLAQHAAIAAREFVPDDPALMQTAQAAAPPSESEAIIKTAQIAAQANVFPTFKRSGGLGALSEADKAASEQKATAAQAAHANGQMRFMPLRRDGFAQAVGTRRDAGVTSMSELKARSKFAPGPVNVGGAALSPATLAAVTAAQSPSGESTRVNAQTAYAYGRRQSAPNAAPAEMPAWFDEAMLGAIDKYKAMQAVQ
jgi:hypothetical protein